MSNTPTSSPFRQPKAVWAVAFACVVSFMGIGLVDPILPALADQLHASPSQVELLFTSYLVITAVAMLVTGWVSSRLGAKRTLIAGLALIVVFAAVAGASGNLGEIVGFRAGWGLGNALFIATSLAVIVASASGGFNGAIVLYETALGVGIAMGPLVGGLLGSVSWRLPFFGVAVLMAIALVATLILLDKTPKPAERTPLSAAFTALRHRGLLTVSVTALCYNWGFFTLLAYSPFPMKLSALHLGLVFTGWGIMVGIFAVFVAPWLQRLLGTPKTLYGNFAFLAADLVAMGLFVNSQLALIVAVIAGGAFIGLNNTLVTQAVMQVSPVPRATASASYGFVRFIGGGLAPFFAGILAAHFSQHIPFYVGAGAVALAIAVLATGHRILTRADQAPAEEPAAPAPAGVEPAEPLPPAGVGEEPTGPLVVGSVYHGGEPISDAVLTLLDTAGHQLDRAVTSDGSYRLRAPGSGHYLVVCTPARRTAGSGERVPRPFAGYVTLDGYAVEHDIELAAAAGSHSPVGGGATCSESTSRP
jgi:MFS family permease